MPMNDQEALPVWWSITEDKLLEMMRRCENGESADFVYMEEYASADIEHVEGED